jgi:Metal-dependent hydrolases of the beta-lactamase superfamily III
MRKEKFMDNQTKLVFLGTGTPNPVPERSGPGVAVIVGERAYLIDSGVGIVRRAAEAKRLGIDALEAKKLSRCFLTHLHSDHTIGLTDLIFTPWVLERKAPLTLIGPAGTKNMAEHILAAYEEDILARRDGLEQANTTGYQVSCKEISEDGLVYEDELVKVSAFAVNHPPFKAYGYKFTTPDKTIVISGDTTPCDNLLAHAKGCDVLVHEVYSSTGIKRRTPKWHKYHTSVHTSSIDLGKIANKVGAKQLILYHQLFMIDENEASTLENLCLREAEMIAQIKENFSGEVFSACDLDIF